MSFAKLCRSCMNEVDSWEIKTFDETLVEMFVFCTRVQMTAEDNLPNYFCSLCTNQIMLSYKFITRAQEINEVYRNVICEPCDIKTEQIIEAACKTEVKIEDKFTPIDDDVISNVSQNFICNLTEQNEIELNNSLDKSEKLEMRQSVKHKKIKNKMKPKNVEVEDSSEFDNYFLSYEDNTCANANDLKDQGNVTEFKHEKDFSDKRQTVYSETKYNMRQRVKKKFDSFFNEEDEQRTNKIICPVCQQTFVSVKRLKRHTKLYCYSNKNTKTPTVSGPNENSEKETKECVKCQRRFKSETWYTRHLQKEHGATVQFHQCPYCPEKFERYHQLVYHKNKEHVESKKHICNACGKRFKLRKQLAVHSLTHSSVRPYICDLCYMSFKMKHVLKNHLMMHENKKLFLCPTCGTSFRTKYTLDAHLVVHTGEKPWPCSQCEYRAGFKASLQRHMLIHTKSRNFKCSYCEKSFRCNGSLSRHIRIHSGERPYKCLQCPLGFTDSWKCKMHLMRFHHLTLEEIPRLAREKPAKNMTLK